MMVGMDSASTDDKKTDKEKSDTKKKSKDQVKVIQMVTNMFSTMDSQLYSIAIFYIYIFGMVAYFKCDFTITVFCCI